MIRETIFLKMYGFSVSDFGSINLNRPKLKQHQKTFEDRDAKMEEGCIFNLPSFCII